MLDLSTKYLGLKLKNPIIAGASGLTANMKKLKDIEKSGAGAVVIKSLFEEEIQLEKYKMEEELHKNDERHAEMTSIHPPVKHAGPREHLMWVKKAKEELNIPVIGSLNAVNEKTWISYAKKLEKTGIDALEINFYHTPESFLKKGGEIEAQQNKILKQIKKEIDIPVAVKLGNNYTNLLNIIKSFDKNGANGFVLFNRFFQPDIDIYKQEHVYPFNLSNKKDYRLALRFSGLLYDKIDADVCASQGIYSGADIVKLILAGANCVQLVSVLYKKDIKYIKTILKDIKNWMEDKKYSKIEDFKGKLSQEKTSDKYTYSRAQYVDLLLKPSKLKVDEPLV